MDKVELKVKPAVYPSAVALVSSGSVDGRKNIATVAWTSNVSANPPMACVALRPSRYTNELVRETGEFVINLTKAGHLKEVDYCGQVSGREKDKFAECGFTAIPARKVKAPLVKECPVNIECVVRDTVRAGTHDVFIAEIVAVSADPDVISNDLVDIGKAGLVAYGSEVYYTIGQAIGRYGFSMSRK